MPDITLCTSQTCESAKQCYRHEATPSNYQSFCDFSHGETVKDCENYQPVKWEPRK